MSFAPSTSDTTQPIAATVAAHSTGVRLRRGAIEGAYLLPALALSALAFYPITGNYFFADDFLNLFKIVNDPVLQYLVTPNGGHLLVTRNAIFYLMFQLFGAHPEGYYWSAFLTHLVNVGLLYWVIRRMTDSAPLASFGAALWGTCPVSEGSLGWYAVYGHVLVATALLIILGQVQRVAAAGQIPSRRMQWGWYALALAASTSFGTGLAVALLLPFVLAILFPAWRGRWWRPPLVSLLVVVPAMYVGLNLLYARLSNENLLKSTPWLTLVTDPAGIVAIWLKLACYGFMRLLLGFYNPTWATAWVWYAIAAAFAAIGVLVGRRSPPIVGRQLVACALLAVGCYGIIAGARAVLVLAIAPRLVTELPRYHYVAQLLLAMLVCVVLAQVGAALPAWSKRALLVGWYGLTLASYARFARVIDNHDPARAGTEQALAAIQHVIDTAAEGQPVFIANRAFGPLPFIPAQFPGWAAVFTIFYPRNTTADGRPIMFVERSKDVIAVGSHGRRTATLFITPEQYRDTRDP